MASTVTNPEDWETCAMKGEALTGEEGMVWTVGDEKRWQAKVRLMEALSSLRCPGLPVEGCGEDGPDGFFDWDLVRKKEEK